MDDYVTIEQAEERLTTVKPLLETARLYKRELEQIAIHYRYDQNLMQQEKPHINLLLGKLSDTINALEELGCYIKDLDIGLVDFLSTFEGRDIFLCWKLGDSHIAHWHELDEGYSKRQEIVDLSKLSVELDFETPYVENEN